MTIYACNISCSCISCQLTDLRHRSSCQNCIKIVACLYIVRFDNDFEIESKYHLEYCVLFLTARILSLQDVYFRSMFSLI